VYASALELPAALVGGPLSILHHDESVKKRIRVYG
jgi:hypothetical protein